MDNNWKEKIALKKNQVSLSAFDFDFQKRMKYWKDSEADYSRHTIVVICQTMLNVSSFEAKSKELEFEHWTNSNMFIYG